MASAVTASYADMRYSQWLTMFRRIVMPVLNGMQTKTFKTTFVQQTPSDYTRPPCTAHVEAFCRVVMSVAPLVALHDDIHEAYIASWVAVMDDHYIDWNCGDQLLVEVANLAYAFFLYPASWTCLPTRVQTAVLDMMRRASDIKPYNNNWLLFQCIVTLWLIKHGRLTSRMTGIHALLDTVESWYVGDSWYKDGPGFHMDYYTSFVLLPFLYVIYKELRNDKTRPIFQTRFNTIVGRIGRHAEFLERLIACDGTFPLFGRSMVYRSAVFHTLAFYAAHAPFGAGGSTGLGYGQVRRALQRVHSRLFDDDRQFDAAGYLHLGFVGAQPDVANRYSNNGSCYFTGLSFLVLGLPRSHPFWTADDMPFTQELAWSGSPLLKKDASRA
jgi:hypothetical protein